MLLGVTVGIVLEPVLVGAVFSDGSTTGSTAVHALSRRIARAGKTTAGLRRRTDGGFSKSAL